MTDLSWIKNKYKEKLLVKVIFDEVENRYMFAYYSDSIDFVNEELLFDLRTVVDDSGLDDVIIYYDSEREMV